MQKQQDAIHNDTRLIERGFPCHQVGAETQRERDTGKAPPVNRLHVWWARRPLTPSRAAIVASLDSADTDPEQFVRQLGIERVQATVNGVPWTLTGKLLDRVREDGIIAASLEVDDTVLRELRKEERARAKNRELAERLIDKDPRLSDYPAIKQWQTESQSIPEPWPKSGDVLELKRTMGDPAWFKQLMALASAHDIRVPNMYGYGRAYANPPTPSKKAFTVLDPTAGGGSIPFEALRLGHKVIANELNPVAATILHATLSYPAGFGLGLMKDISRWGESLQATLSTSMSAMFNEHGDIPSQELKKLEKHLEKCPELFDDYTQEEVTTFLYARQVTCPHCGGDAPLLNTFWLSKQASDKWGVRIVTDGRERNGTVTFEPYRLNDSRGPNGEDPDQSTVTRGVGTCVHCQQAIAADEIKRQARGESPHGQWRDRLYAVVAVRYQPKLDKNGLPQYYKSGEKKDQIKTEKVRFFRAPNQRDLDALAAAEQRLQEKWPEWEAQGLIPTEKFPQGNDVRPITYGMPRWCDMFTPRQLLGHVTLIEGLNKLKPRILEELGPERGKAVATYLQFAIDKGLDYNSRQTLWHASRGVIAHVFTRHDFSFKWTFGEMIFTGPNSGLAWGVKQILDAYGKIAELLIPRSEQVSDKNDALVQILNQTAAHMPQVADSSVDLVCMDPPYYNNVQYAELSDYFYVWQKRTLKDLYPEVYSRRLTDKANEAVANPDRDGSSRKAYQAYERMMGEIFSECTRVLKDDGILTLMFTHKSQDAWEALTTSLIENGWIITSSFPVESESSTDIHHKDIAAAASSIFISCRKRLTAEGSTPATWTGFGGRGVQQQIAHAVKQGLEDFAELKLNPVDEMVAAYGRALHVLSEHWPVVDGDEQVGPVRAMNEASRVVAENHIRRITNGRLSVDDLDPETAMSLTLYGVYGLNQLPYHEALNLSRSLNIDLSQRNGGYRVEGQMIGINSESGGRGRRSDSNAKYQAPLVRKGSKLRLVAPEERDARRIENPQTEWDVMQGTILAYREGDIPVARAYLQQHADGREERVGDLLEVWTSEMGDRELRKEGENLLFGLR